MVSVYLNQIKGFFKKNDSTTVSYTSTALNAIENLFDMS